MSLKNVSQTNCKGLDLPSLNFQSVLLEDYITLKETIILETSQFFPLNLLLDGRKSYIAIKFWGLYSSGKHVTYHFTNKILNHQDICAKDSPSLFQRSANYAHVCFV